jgi:hypothetical protein
MLQSAFTRRASCLDLAGCFSTFNKIVVQPLASITNVTLVTSALVFVLVLLILANLYYLNYLNYKTLQANHA